MEETIVLGGGCFWCLDAAYKLIKGVTKVVEGYSGGRVEDPTDDQIYSMTTGHAEVVRVTFDPSKISLSDILDVFWTIHDPTTKDRQGVDTGPIYRSVIFYLDDQQKPVIDKSLAKANEVWNGKIVTEVAKLANFYPAAEYHQHYEENRPDYCQLIINPKLDKLKSKLAKLLAE